MAEYRGVNSSTSWRYLEKETGRQRESLIKWYELYEKYPVYDDNKRMASEKVLVKL
ncbi:MAG: hypothetical protein KAW92_11500 [Candidatus Cloacimonetes bacterium]|nr:hypothetical protein [Candidatus Cloacimonadota bacterium]